MGRNEWSSLSARLFGAIFGSGATFIFFLGGSTGEIGDNAVGEAMGLGGDCDRRLTLRVVIVSPSFAIGRWMFGYASWGCCMARIRGGGWCWGRGWDFYQGSGALTREYNGMEVCAKPNSENADLILSGESRLGSEGKLGSEYCLGMIH